ncbi:MAG TPA: LURP-one-related family protein [Phycisphaerales bacterium]|nr:LURP-one-related family protein [Phycisphaerales bacterium]
MRYVMRQKVFCFGDDYTIKDERGVDRYIVDGAAFTIRDSTSFRDMEGRELCHIHKRLLSFGPTYEIERNGRTTTVAKHLFTFFNCRFTVDVPGPNDLEASGNFTDHEYTFKDAGGKVVATVSKAWFAWTDTYGVEVAEAADDVLILAATVVIDLCCHGDKRR